MSVARFEWDSEKDLENQKKHGVAFYLAQHTFTDPRRVIAEDLSHSAKEKRYYCFGEVGGGILTVRTLSGYKAPVTGEKEREFMSAKIKYTDEPLGKLKVIPDFLPPPDELVFREEGVKVTIALSKKSVEFFKTQAQKHNTQYQRMIRRLLDAYAEHHSQRRVSRSKAADR